MSYPTIQRILHAGLIQRYHTNPSTMQQTVAHHSWGVAVLYPLVCQCLGKNPELNALHYCLVHDAPELYTGDVPAPVKWGSPMLCQALDAIEDRINAELGHDWDFSQETRRIIKLCDILELIWWSTLQVTMGNAYYTPIVRRAVLFTSSKFGDLLYSSPALDQLFTDLQLNASVGADNV